MSDKARALRLLVLAVLPILAGCATILHGPNQSVEISSDPPGAKVLVLPEQTTLVTPGTADVSRKRIHTLLFELPCYRPATGYLDRDADETHAVLLNLILGGIIGISIDYSTGAVFRLIPDPIHVKLERLESSPADCR